MGFANIFQILIPKDKIFFPLIEKDAENIVKAAILLNKMMLINDESDRTVVCGEIKAAEKAGDDITHLIFDELNKSFITPFDREDINQLASKMDDVLDMINGCSERFRLYKVRDMNPAYLRLSELILQCTREIHNAVLGLNNLKQPQKIKASCMRINEIENEADDIYHQAISELFENQKDAKELIKTHEILNTLESATDLAEDVSDVIKTILVKSA
ncbi:MAG: DUF47 family protein [Bacteroidota bacterium]